MEKECRCERPKLEKKYLFIKGCCIDNPAEIEVHVFKAGTVEEAIETAEGLADTFSNNFLVALTDEVRKKIMDVLIRR